MPTFVSGAVEGIVDQAVFERLLQSVKGQAGNLFVTNGKTNLLNRLRGFNEASRHTPWLVLVDLDDDADCAPPFRASHLANPAPQMTFRVAVRAIEAWLLADRERIARLLEVDERLVAKRPEELSDPKRAFVDLARRSGSRDVRRDFVPREGSGRKVGPLYASRVIEFVQDRRSGWRPKVAAHSADSLHRCLRRLEQLVAARRRRIR